MSYRNSQSYHRGKLPNMALVRTLRRLAIVVGALFLGVGLTIVGINLVWSDDYELLGVVLTPVWAGALFGGAYLFPEAMGELGHPVAWAIGITLNAIFLVAVAAGLVTLAKLARKHKRSNDARAT